MSDKPLDKLTAGDIMQRQIVAVAPQETLRDAMNLMTENHVTGLPVMDTRSRCIGVITATDILNYEQEHSEFVAEANTDMAQHFDMDSQRWESVRVSSFALEEFGDVKVQEVMARDLVSVHQKMSVIDVARLMKEHSVHRVLVLDDQQRIYGIISSSDYVSLVAEM